MMAMEKLIIEQLKQGNEDAFNNELQKVLKDIIKTHRLRKYWMMRFFICGNTEVILKLNIQFVHTLCVLSVIIV